MASLLQQYLVNDDTARGLLQPGQGLGDFGTRRQLCYALGLIPKNLSEDLKFIGQIRNRFGHGFFDVRFSDSDIAALHEKLTGCGVIELAPIAVQKLSAPAEQAEKTVTASPSYTLAFPILERYGRKGHGVPLLARDKFTLAVQAAAMVLLWKAEDATHRERDTDIRWIVSEANKDSQPVQSPSVS